MSADGNNPDPFEQDGKPEIDQLRAEVAALQESVAALRNQISEMGAKIEGVDDIQGDENVTPANGFIEMDRSVAKHPVIRFRADRLPSGGGGEYVGGDDTNITFVECTDPEDARYGKIMIDVYYV